MRLIVLKALILFSVLCTGLHVPAAAHSDHGGYQEVSAHLADEHFTSVHEGDTDDSSPDQTHDLLHHHHCPSAMMMVGGDDAAPIVSARDIVHADEAAALASRALEPLTEPPLA